MSVLFNQSVRVFSTQFATIKGVTARRACAKANRGQKILALMLSLVSFSVGAQVNTGGKTQVPLPSSFGEPGSISVSPSFGAVSDSITLTVPPGRRGLQPQLTLSYSSMGGSGIAGKGWGIGMSRVEKWRAEGIPARPLPEGTEATDKYSFSLGASGGELSDPNETGVYRARIEKDYLPFRRNGDGWGVYDGRGNYYTFGSSENSRIEGELWLLDKVEDPTGNTMTYHYERECSPGLNAPCIDSENQKLYLSEILYTGHAPSNDPGANRVVFEYEVRPDKRISYQRGVREASNLRMSRVSLYAQGLLARRYELDYTRYAGGPSLLRRVQLVGADDVSRVTLRSLEYSQKSAGWSQPSIGTLPSDYELIDPDGNGTGLKVMDFNGDGFADLLAEDPDSDSSDLVILLGDGQGQYSRSDPWTDALPDPVALSGAAASGIRFVDVNGDGFTDILVARLNEKGVYLNDGFGWSFNTAWSDSLDSLAVLEVAYALGDYPANCLAPHCDGEDSPDNCTPSHCIPAVPATEETDEIPANPPGCDLGDLQQYIPVHCEESDAHDGIFDPDIQSTFDPDAENCQPAHCSDFTVGADDPFWTLGFPDLPEPQVEPFALVGEAGQATGIELADLNGDGLVDIAWSIAYYGSYFILEQPRFIRAVYLNGGDQNPGWHFNFELAQALSVLRNTEGEADFFVVENAYRGYSFQDVNGDGFNDIVRTIDEIQEVYLRVGDDWVADSELGLNYAQSMKDYGIFSITRDLQQNQGLVPMDFNEDGLVDYARLKADAYAAFVNTGNGWIPDAAMAQVLQNSDSAFLDEDGKPLGTTMADVNGDGSADLLSASGQAPGDKRIVLGGAPRSSLLVRAISTIGEVSEIEWTWSTRFDNTTASGKQGLPFPMTIASRISRSNGRGNTLVTDFEYANGLFADRTLRGFGWMARQPSTGLRTEMVFYDDEIRTGRPVEISGYDSSGMLRQRTTFDVELVAAGDHVTQVQLRRIDKESRDPGAATHSLTVNTFDDRLQIIEVDSDPIVGPSGDESRTTTTFVRDDSAGIWALPAVNRTRGPSNELLAEQISYYDELPQGQANKGLLSRTREMVESGVYVDQLFEYDVFGNPIKVVDREGQESLYSYDAATGTFRVGAEDALGRTTGTEYDPRFGTVIRDEDASGNATVSTYDAFGRISRIVHPGDENSPFGSNSITYSPVGNPNQQFIHMRVAETPTGDEFSESTSMFDGWGSIYETHDQGPNGKTIVNLFEFDDMGLPKSGTAPFFLGDSPSVANTIRDDLGRPTELVDQLGQTARVNYRGREVEITDPRGNSAKFSYAPTGPVEKVTRVVDSEIQAASYDYDVLGRLVKVTDALGNETHVGYDMLGRRTRLEDPNAGTFEYRYDNQGRLIEQVGSDGLSTLLRYSATGELLEKTLPDGTVHRFTYGGPGAVNAVGRVVEMEDAAGIVRFAYDVRGNVIEQRRTVGDRTYVTGFSYDSLDRVLRIVYPDGFIVDYSYGAGGNISSVTDGDGRVLAEGFEYNAEGRITAFVFGNGARTDYSYDELGRMATSQTVTSKGLGIQELLFEFDAANNVVALDDLVAGSSQQFVYDEANRLVEATGRYGEETYEYDAIGNLIRKGNLLYVHDLLQPQRVSCAVDLTPGKGKGAKGTSSIDPCAATATGIDQTQVSGAFAIDYDARGNVAGKGSRTFEYDGDNRLSRVYEANGRLVESNHYDSEGGLVVRESASEARIYIDGLYEEGQSHVSRHVYAGPLLLATLVKNRADVELIETTLPPSSGFMYTAGLSGSGILLLLIWLDRLFGWRFRRGITAGARAVRTSPGSTMLALVLLCSGWPIQSFAANQKASGDEKSYYYHANHLGSVNVVTDEKERVTARRDYRPYGEPIDWSGAQAGPRELLNTFQGQQFDDQTGLYYFKARHYDAELGRFMSADTIVADLNDPRTLHRYAFEGGNPVNYIDPTGRDFLGIGSWVEGAYDDASDWVEGAWGDAGAWLEAAGADFVQFFEDYGTEILIVTGGLLLIGLGVFTFGATSVVGLALIGGGVGFAIGGGIAAGLGYKADDWQFWAAAGTGFALGAAGAVAYGGFATTVVAGYSVSAKTAVIIGSVAKGAFWGGVVSGGAEVIAGVAGGGSADEIFNSTLTQIGVGFGLGALGGGLAGGLEVGIAGGGLLSKAPNGLRWLASGAKGLAKAKDGFGLIFAGFASYGRNRPTTLTDLVYDSDFRSFGRGAEKIGNLYAQVPGKIGEAFATPPLTTGQATY